MQKDSAEPKEYEKSPSSSFSTISEHFKRDSDKNLIDEETLEVLTTKETNMVRRINKLILNDDTKIYFSEAEKNDDAFACQECAVNRKGLEENHKNVLRLMKRLNTNIERNELRLYDLEIRDIVKNEWRQLAIIIDRLMLVIFILLTSIVLASIYFQRPNV
jgi:hypothetical protein